MRCECIMKENDSLEGECDPAHKPGRCKMKAKREYRKVGGKILNLCNGCSRALNRRWHPWKEKAA